ncbi:MAG: zinc ribbon domain-containing protein, partial [Planctomycetota bacterium]
AQILEMMKDVEADEAECENIRQQIEDQKQKLDQIRKDAEIQAQKYEEEIKDIQAEWDQAAELIPTEPLEVFNRVAETYDGEALSTIDKENENTGAYSCGGCFMGITAESVNVLMTRDDIIRCPNCTRILVLG